MRHFDLVDFESGRGEKRRKHRSVGEAFQRSSGSKGAEQDGAINFVRVLKGRRINNLLVFDLTLLFSPNLQILCIASVTEMIFKFGEGKIRRSKAVSYLYGVPKHLIPALMFSAS
jgi:hypothetical protein